MALHRVFADIELARNIAILHAAGDGVCDLSLSVREAMERRLRRALALPSIIRETAHDLAGEFVGESQLASGDNTNGFEEALRSIPFHDQPTGSESDDLGIVGF